MERGASDSFGYSKTFVKPFRAFFPPVPKGVNYLTLGTKQTLGALQQALVCVSGGRSWHKAAAKSFPVRTPQASNSQALAGLMHPAGPQGEALQS